MQILLDKNNFIVGFAEVGGFEDGIEIDENIIPQDFIQNYKPKHYLYQDEQIIVNPNYEEESNTSYISPIITSNVSDKELRTMFANMQVQIVQGNKMVNQLTQQNANLSQQIVQLSQEVEKLKGGNSDETTVSEV